MGVGVIWPVAPTAVPSVLSSLRATGANVVSYHGQSWTWPSLTTSLLSPTTALSLYAPPETVIHQPIASEFTRTSFMVGRVCKKMFLFLHIISEKRLRYLQESLKENGITPKRHGHRCRLPANMVSFADTQRVVEFLGTYAETNAIFWQGRDPRCKHTDVQLLPSSTTKSERCLRRKLEMAPSCFYRVTNTSAPQNGHIQKVP